MILFTKKKTSTSKFQVYVFMANLSSCSILPTLEKAENYSAIFGFFNCHNQYLKDYLENQTVC